MAITRRNLLCGIGAATLIGAPPARASMSSSRVFRVLRGSEEIGEQSLTVTRGADGVIVDIAIDIRVRILGITVFRYGMQNREVWRDGVLQSMDAKTDDDGTSGFAQVRREGAELVVKGSAFEGRVQGDAATTSYWNPAYLRRPVWISSQTGQPLSVLARRSGTDRLSIGPERMAATTWTVSGDIDLDIYFVEKEWVGTRFDARGENGLILATGVMPPLEPFFA